MHNRHTFFAVFPNPPCNYQNSATLRRMSITASRHLPGTGIQLQEVASNITEALDQVQLQPAHSLIEQGDHYLQQYGTFRSVLQPATA